MNAQTCRGTRLRHAGAIRGTAGFTLVELVVTIGVIGILASIAIATYANYRTKAQTVEARLGLHNIWVMEYSYEKDNNRYTSDLNVLGFQMSGTPRYSYSLQADNSSFTARAEANLDRDAALDVWEIYSSTLEAVHLAAD